MNHLFISCMSCSPLRNICLFNVPKPRKFLQTSYSTDFKGIPELPCIAQIKSEVNFPASAALIDPFMYEFIPGKFGCLKKFQQNFAAAPRRVLIFFYLGGILRNPVTVFKRLMQFETRHVCLQNRISYNINCVLKFDSTIYW